MSGSRGFVEKNLDLEHFVNYSIDTDKFEIRSYNTRKLLRNAMRIKEISFFRKSPFTI